MLWANVEKNNAAKLEEMHRKTLLDDAENLMNWLKLAQFLYLHYQYEEVLILLEQARCLFPLEPAPYFMLANTYHRIGKIEAARETLHRAPPIPGQNLKMKLFQLELSMLLEQDLEAFAMEALAIDPTNEVALTKLCHVFRKQNRLVCMIPLCQAALRQDPDHATARYLLAVAYTVLGLAHDARETINLEKWMSIRDISPAEGYVAKAFEAALVDEIMANPTLKPDPLYKATINGLQTDVIIPNGTNHPIGALLDKLRFAVNDMVDGFITVRRPKRVQLNAWAVVYPGNGRQRAHYHPGAWLSGVYYVSVPKNMSDDSHRGHLVVGALELDGVTIDPPWGIQYIQPNAGKLVLFPSYFPHATIPTQSNEKRICVAFNVVSI